MYKTFPSEEERRKKERERGGGREGEKRSGNKYLDNHQPGEGTERPLLWMPEASQDKKKTTLANSTIKYWKNKESGLDFPLVEELLM